MAQRIEVEEIVTLRDYEESAPLAAAVRELRAEARQIVPLLADRTLWMVNSTAMGGGVAEMLPAMVALLRDLGVRTEWLVIETQEPAFFSLTKRLHNLLHGEGDPVISPTDRAVFEEVNRVNAEQIQPWLRRGDILAVHDPQPMPLAGMLGAELDLRCIWRCHIGLDERNHHTRTAWDFLLPYSDAYHHAVFSAPEYIPDFFSARGTVIYPAVNPLTAKNQDLSVHSIAGVLANAALATNFGPVLGDPFERVAERLLPNGMFAPANMLEDIGLLFRPIITQISRWDRLKGFSPLMAAFARLKERLRGEDEIDPFHRRRLDLVRLMLVGPDPASVADDPEGREVLEDLIREYQQLDPAIQRDVALIALPMHSRVDNALMVNAIQRTSSIIAQNSIREGFGLTITEAMWKGVPILSNRHAVGPRQQVRDHLDGRLVDDPRDVDALADAMDEMLRDSVHRGAMGRSAQRRAHEHFLIFNQLSHWLRLLARSVRDAPR